MGPATTPLESSPLYRCLAAAAGRKQTPFAPRVSSVHLVWLNRVSVTHNVYHIPYVRLGVTCKTDITGLVAKLML